MFSRTGFRRNQSPTITVPKRGVKKLRYLENSQIDNVPGPSISFFFNEVEIPNRGPKK